MRRENATAAISGSEFVPSWMADLGLKAGANGWLNVSKAQLRSFQRPDQPLKVQVYATLLLHAPGYNGQEAVISRGPGKKGPLTPGDIIRELFAEARKYYFAGGIKATDEELLRIRETKEHIRRALNDLEGDGVVMRTDMKGTPLRELSADQLRRLPSGKVRMFCWIFPKPADPKVVLRAWEASQPADSSPDMSKVEVAKDWLPLPPIWKILNLFQIEKPEKAQISTPEYQKKIEVAWHAARKVFLEVVTEWLPEVAATEPPEVATGGGALKGKAEMKPLKENHPVSQPVSQPSETFETDRPTDSPLAASLEHSPEGMAALLLDELGPQFPGQMPGKALCEQTVEALGDTPWPEFSAKLRNRKWKASDGMGIVLPLAREVQARWRADAGKRQERKPPAAARSLCPKCSGAGLLNGKKWESLQDLAGVLPAECCDCEDGITTLGLLDGSAKAAGGNV